MPILKRQIYADFETTTREIKGKHFDPLPYAICLGWNPEYKIFKKASNNVLLKNYKGKMDGLITHSMDTLFARLIKLKGADYTIYFNNLKKFDGYFILMYLITNKLFKFVPPVDYYDKPPKYYKKFINERKKEINKKQWRNLRPFEFDFLMDENFTIYEIRLGLLEKKRNNKKKSSKYRILSFRCFLALFQTSIGEMGKVLNFEKGNTPLDVHFPFENLKHLLKRDDIINYLWRDVFIMYEYAKIMAKELPPKKWKLTIAGTSYNEWTRWIGKINYKYIGYEKVQNADLYFKNGKYTGEFQIGKSLVKKLLPVEWLKIEKEKGKSWFEYLHENYYEGGLTIINESHRGKLLEGRYFDINSSYASRMASMAMVPYGIPSLGNDKNKPFKFYRVRILNELKNEKGLPFVKSSDEIKKQYPQKLSSGSIIFLTSANISQFKKYYNVKNKDVSLIVELSFLQMPARFLFGEFVSYFFNMKIEGKKTGNVGFERIGKLINNSTYGKFAQKPTRHRRDWTGSKWTKMKSYITKGEKYLPLGIVIPQYARMSVVDAVGFNFECVMGVDTDSITTTDASKLNIKRGKGLGEWGEEIGLQNARFIFRQTKQYAAFEPVSHEVLKFVYAGLDARKIGENGVPIWKTITPVDMLIGRKIENQLEPTRLAMGLSLDSIIKSIKPIWDLPHLKDRTRLKTFGELEKYLPKFYKFLGIL